MVGYHPQTDWAYENGALLLQAGAGWAIQLAAETARRQGEGAAYEALSRAARQPFTANPTTVCPEVLERYGSESFFHQWLAHPQADDYWAQITPELSSIDLPMLHIGGWFDPYLRGDIRLYKEMAARSQYHQPFWVGPWGHIPWSRRAGERDFGPQAESPIDRLQLLWFDHTLKGHPLDPSLSGVSWFEMGTNRWRRFQGWPQAYRQKYSLASTGLASIRQDDGILSPWIESRDPTELPLVAGGSNVAGDRNSAASDTIVHDPWRPVPALGGHGAIPAGVFDRAALDGRSDVLTYTTAPLTTPLAIAGEITVVLICELDCPSFDLSVTLSEVFPSGQVYPLCQGYGRFKTRAAVPAPYQLPLQPTCFCLAVGQALRLSISGACFPAYAMNSGTVDGLPEPTSAKIITLRVRVGATATYVDLPMVPVRGNYRSDSASPGWD